MPDIDTEQIGIAFDMSGCPNRCRHCWLGPASERTMTAEDVRWGAQRFREYFESDKAGSKKLTVTTWFREPDFTEDYRRLYALEEELSDGPPARFELLSIWRLARDDGYAEWAKSVGTDSCQVTFFGLEATNDWFHRRRGAFADALSATDRLLKAGVKPRWQLFLSTKVLSELVDFTEMVERLELKKRVQYLGAEFEIFAHLPGPDYEGRKIESLRPTVEQLQSIPQVLTAASQRHFGRQTLWHSEGTLHSQIRAGSTGRDGAL
ncbi:MAG: hypothetical protein GF331_22010, partial [Chitinivibrionales bacterium]|nr:hypothetical protein [Chitinivibrionales bacterium]